MLVKGGGIDELDRRPPEPPPLLDLRLFRSELLNFGFTLAAPCLSKLSSLAGFKGAMVSGSSSMEDEVKIDR